MLLGATEARASKEMGDVVEFMEKLFNLTKSPCMVALEKGNQSDPLEKMKQKLKLNSPPVRPSLPVSHLQTVYPEVNNSIYFWEPRFALPSWDRLKYI